MSRFKPLLFLVVLICALCYESASIPAQAQNSSDFNGDGRSDVLWRNTSTGDVSLWLMNGLNIAGQGYVAQGVPLVWEVAGTGDFNGDGKADVLWRNISTGDVYLWLMNGLNIASQGYVAYGVPLEWRVAGTGDFNGDHRSDVLWRNTKTGDVYLWEMNGLNIAGQGYVAQGVPLVWEVAGTGDFNGDGLSDVLWRNTGTGDVYLWLMNGLNVAGQGYVAYGVPLIWQIVGVGDVNGDGKADVLWRNTGTGDVYLWEMNGLNIASQGYVAQGVPLVWEVAGTGDFNGDGFSDVLWRNTSSGDVYLWEMNGLNIAGQGYVAQGVPLDWQIAQRLRKVSGLDFSPYVNAGQDPNQGTQISYSQLVSLLIKIAPYTQWVRTFGSTNGLENVGAIAHSLGLKTAIGAFLDADTTNNNAQIASLVQQAKAGNVDVAIVGNEDFVRGDLTEAQVIAYINQVKQQIPSGIKVTYVDTWDRIVAHPNVIAAVDIVAVNIYPFYEDVPIDQALGQLQADYQRTVQAAGGKPVWITETGWPSQGNPPSFSPAAMPSPANATTYFIQVEQWARSAGIRLFYFEAFDEPYKANYNDYPSWGIWDVNGHLKPAMYAPFQ